MLPPNGQHPPPLDYLINVAFCDKKMINKNKVIATKKIKKIKNIACKKTHKHVIFFISTQFKRHLAYNIEHK